MAKQLLVESQALLEKILALTPVRAMMTELYAHHADTARHAVRVAVYAIALGLHYDFEGKNLETVGLGALLHDTGKCDIELEILNGKNNLTMAERARITHHPRHSFLRLTDTLFEQARRVAVAHHEFQRQPYPRRGIERRSNVQRTNERRRYRPFIRIAAELVAVADMYDALTSARTYKTAWPKERVFSVMKEEFKGHPDIINVLMTLQ